MALMAEWMSHSTLERRVRGSKPPGALASEPELEKRWSGAVSIGVSFHWSDVGELLEYREVGVPLMWSNVGDEK